MNLSPLSMNLEWQVDLLRRQYLQLVEPEQLLLPAAKTLKSPGVQARLYSRLFNNDTFSFPPPDRYRFRVLKRVINLLEKSFIDPDEDVGFPCRICFKNEIVPVLVYLMPI